MNAGCTPEPDHAALGLGAVMELSSPNKPCSFSIPWKPGAATTADGTDVGAIRIPTPTGALVLPIVLHFHRTIDNCLSPQFSCALIDVATDRVWRCAAR